MPQAYPLFAAEILPCKVFTCKRCDVRRCRRDSGANSSSADEVPACGLRCAALAAMYESARANVVCVKEMAGIWSSGGGRPAKKRCS